MSQVAEKLATGQRAGQAYLKGRVEAIKKHGDLWLHLVKLPAADEFSHPATVEVSCVQKLGGPGDPFGAWVTVGGVPHSFTTREGEYVKTARNRLYVEQ